MKTDIWTNTKFDEWFKDGTAFIFDVQWARESFFKTLNAALGHGKKDKHFNNWFNYRPEEEYEAIIYLIQKDLEYSNQTEQFKNTFGANLDYIKSQFKKNGTYKTLKGDSLLFKVIYDVLTWKINPKKITK